MEKFHKIKKVFAILFLAIMLPLTGCSSEATTSEGTGENTKVQQENKKTSEETETTKETDAIKETQGVAAGNGSNKSTAQKNNEESETENKSEGVKNTQTKPTADGILSVADIPEYSGNPYVVINGNNPGFLQSDLSTTSYEYYSELDDLGRCGVVYACIGQDLMPTEERGNIGSVKPTGWQTVKYDVVEGKYLYNRCHLIGFQLSGENANKKNLITGTRYLNIEGMLPFENMVADYVKETGNHVMYRVTPIFEGDNLLASGVQMEAKSVEDDGEGILFNVYCYNVQPGITIHYATGESSNGASLITEETIMKTDTTQKTTEEKTTEEKITTTKTETDITTKNQVIEQSELETTAKTEIINSVDTSMVWKAEAGTKYHSINNCGKMNPNKASYITQKQAESEGLSPCSKCW